MKSARYFLGSDNSSHWYLVPVAHRKDWEAWTNLDEDDEASWEAPDFAVRLGGHLSQVTFADPKGWE